MVYFNIKQLLFIPVLFTSFVTHAHVEKPHLSQETNVNLAIKKIEIVDYDITRDYSAIEQIIKNDWHMLISDEDNSFDEDLFKFLFVDSQSANQRGFKTIIKVACVDGKTAGVMTYVQGDSDHGMVELLGVDQNFRNLGLGYKLLETAQELAQKANRVGLDLFVDEANEKAINLYKKFGFKRIIGFFDNNRAVARMSKFFTTQEKFAY